VVEPEAEPRSGRADLGTDKTGWCTNWVEWPSLVSGAARVQMVMQVTWILSIWQGTVGRAEGDGGWQRPTRGLGHWGTAAGETTARELGKGVAGTGLVMLGQLWQPGLHDRKEKLVAQGQESSMGLGTAQQLIGGPAKRLRACGGVVWWHWSLAALIGFSIGLMENKLRRGCHGWQEECREG